MPEIRTIMTLKRKRAEIAASIKPYEKHLAQARSDLAHVEATVRIFAASGRPADIAFAFISSRASSRVSLWPENQNGTRRRALDSQLHFACSNRVHDCLGAGYSVELDHGTCDDLIDGFLAQP